MSHSLWETDGRMNRKTSSPEPAPAAGELERYALALCERICAELRRRRLDQGKSLRGLALPGLLTRQTIANNERGRHSPSLYVLALHCLRLGTTVEDLLGAKARRTRAGGRQVF